ncbi:MAG: hypothetical protein OXP71_03725 [Candidatus Poribacteria bacterium]|nr:hypothetical protein [Candidatus Poribacteria bacterium]
MLRILSFMLVLPLIGGTVWSYDAYEVEIDRYDNPYLNSSRYNIRVKKTTPKPIGIVETEIAAIRAARRYTSPAGTIREILAARDAAEPFAERARAQAELYRAQADLYKAQTRAVNRRARQKLREQAEFYEEVIAMAQKYVPDSTQQQQPNPDTYKSRAARARLLSRAGVKSKSKTYSQPTRYISPDPGHGLPFGERMRQLKERQKSRRSAAERQAKQPLYTYRYVNGEIKKVLLPDGELW